MESNVKQAMESVASVVVGSQNEVIVDGQQWSQTREGGVVYWSHEEARGGGEEHSTGSVQEVVPVSGGDIGVLQGHANEGTFLCLDCDMPLNIEMKKDHLLVCKSRQQDADKVDHHQMVTSTPLGHGPTLSLCVSDQSPITKINKDMCNNTPLTRTTNLLQPVSNQPISRTSTLIQTVNDENARSAFLEQNRRSAILVSEGNVVSRVGLITSEGTIVRGGGGMLTTDSEGNIVRGGGGLLTTVSQSNIVQAGGGLLTTVSEANQVARAGLLSEHSVISRADLMDGQTVISRSGIIDEQGITRPVISIGGTITQQTMITSVADENQLRHSAIIAANDNQLSREVLIDTDGAQLSGSTLITSIGDDGTQMSRSTLIATMTEDGIMVTTSPNGSLQLIEPVLTHDPNINEAYVTSTTSPVLTKLKPLPTIQVICQPNGKQCKVYTDEVENYKCTVCKYTTTTAEKLAGHKCVTLSEKLTCAECGYVAETTASLSRHTVTHRKVRNTFSLPLKCPPELDQFVEKRCLENGDEVFGCKLCNFTSSLYLSIKHHTQTHSIENKFSCDQCNFSCKLEVNLRNHKLTHMERKEADVGEEVGKKRKRRGKGSIVCKICDYEYRKGEEPNAHIDKHLILNSDQMYQCLVCNLNCDTLQTVRDHVRIHVKSWPYQCEKCPYTCYKVLEMKIHEKTIHCRKEYSCEECDYKCKLSSNLKLHVKTEHPKKLPRMPILERSQIQTRRRAKMAMLAVNCTKCDFITKTRPELEAHMKKEHKNNKIYKCTECDYTCKLLWNFEHHKMLHEGDASSSD